MDTPLVSAVSTALLPPLSDELIRERAYSIWLNEGEPPDRADAHWLQAIDELRAAGSANGAPRDASDADADEARR